MSKRSGSKASQLPPASPDSRQQQQHSPQEPNNTSNNNARRTTAPSRLGYPQSFSNSPQRVVSSPDRGYEPVPFAHPYGLVRPRTSNSGLYRSTSSQVPGSEALRSRPSLNLTFSHATSSGSTERPSSVPASAHSVPYQDSPAGTQTSSDSFNILPTLPLDPHDNNTNIPLASNVIYERQLLQKKHGFPLWIPHPNIRLPKSYTDKGVSVGDVGIITPHGAFDYLFNVCLHAEHPNNAGQLPEGFVPLLIQQKDISEFPDHGSGSFLCSSSVTSSQNASLLSFESVESEGAILAMPEGAIHEDIRNLSKFREYAALHAQSWYRFANGACGREIENGELHLVTGCDKTTSWGMATFSRLTSQRQSQTPPSQQYQTQTQPSVVVSPPAAAPTQSISLDFMFDKDGDGGCVCSWGQTGNAEVKANSMVADPDGNRFRNQCTFVRSYTVTLSEDEWTKVQASVEVGSGYASDATVDTTSSRSSNVSKNLKRLFSSFGQKSYSSSQRPQVVTKSYTDVPRRSLHPSSIINKLLLKKHPRARVAITHDEEWATLISDPSNPPPTSTVWEDIRSKFEVILDASGGVYLSLKEPATGNLDQKSILADIELPLSSDGSQPTVSRLPSDEKDEEADPTRFTLESLIDSLVTAETPSPSEARLLIKMLSTQPPPPFPFLQRVFFPLFADTPNSAAIHALGFDVLTAYWENPYVKESDEPRMSSDRLSCFTFFLEPTLATWAPDSWEYQLKAFRAVTKEGTRIKGIETTVIDLLKRWLLVAIQRLVHLTGTSEAESAAECERCVLGVGKFLAELLKEKNNVARVYDEVLIDVLRFHSTLIDLLILIPGPQSQSAQTLLLESPASPPLIENTLRRGHKKRPSSLSLSSIMFSTPSASSPTPKPPPTPASASLKHPAELAISLYIEHLTGHLLDLTSKQLESILPPLFRGLAFCASPLPRLTLHVPPNKLGTLEDRIVELLNTLVPSSSFPTCMRILKGHLFPSLRPDQADLKDTTTAEMATTTTAPAVAPTVAASSDDESTPKGKPGFTEFPFPVPTPPAHTSGNDGPLDNRSFDSLYLMIMTGLGASRTLRNYVRRALAARLENVYLSQDTPAAKSSSSSSRFAIDQDLMDVVWLRHDHRGASGGGGGGLPLDGEEETPQQQPVGDQTLASSIDAWVNWDTDLPTLELHTMQYNMYEKIREGREHILEEAAGILKDIYQEFDSREETTLTGEETELDPINDGLKCLSAYLVSLQSPDGTPFIINAFLPGDAPTPLLRSITTLLSRDFTRCHNPLLAEIMLIVCEHVTDENTARIPAILKEYHQLMPICPEWLDNWTRIIKVPTLLNVNRPQTRKAIIDTMHRVYFAIKDIPTQRSLFAKLVIELSGNVIGPVFCDPLWEILEDDAVAVIVEMTDENVPLRAPDDNDDSPESVRLLIELANSQPDTTALPVVRSLINVFCQISFTPTSRPQAVQKISLALFQMFVKMLTEGTSVACRLVVLQFLMRLRADRMHRVYLAIESCDTNGLISYLASLINRVPDSLMKAHRDEILEEHVARTRQARPRAMQGKNSGSGSHSTARARSRTLIAEPVPQKEYNPLWQLPETLSFRTAEVDSVKGFVISYDPEGPNRVIVLPVSQYILSLATLIKREPSWELVSYILCYLPVQLSNKHLFCGPNTRTTITEMMLMMAAGIVRGDLASQTAEDCPEHLKLRDLQGLAQHTLSTMISYRGNFDFQSRVLLLEAFKSGLDGPFSTIKCSLHALTLAAYETPYSMAKALPKILEKLSQIMSNPNMAVHILAFLNIVGSLPNLYASFTEDDFKMVFGVALQYLQHYNQLRESPTRSWALSQHVRQQSYCAVYTWFSVLKLPDREQHIPYITRQLLLANEGKEEVDGLTQVCFDWLARNTYGMANSKTVVHDIVLQSNIAKPQNKPFKKSWMLSNSFISVRPTQRPGWVELMSRRPSGSASLVCRRDDFLLFARLTKTEEMSGFLAVLENSSDELEMPTSPTREIFPQETIVYPSSHQIGEGESDYEQLAFAFHLFFHLTPLPERAAIAPEIKDVTDVPALTKSIGLLDKVPVIDTHKVGIMYVAPGQTNELDILRNSHGSQAYGRFLDGIGKLITIRTEKDIYTGSLESDEDGEYAYAWWDDIRQILFHTATLMPTHEHDPHLNYKKRHIGNDYVRIVWNDSGLPYKFDTLATAFQFVNIVIEPHSLGTISAFSDDSHENEYFRVSVQTASGMTECTPVGPFKIVSAMNLPQYIRQLSVLTDCFTGIFSSTSHDTQRVEIITNWNARLDSMGRFRKQANDFFQTREQRSNDNNTSGNNHNNTPST